MPEPIRIDSHVHLYRSVEEGIAEKNGYQVWEYGQKDVVAVSAYPGTVDDILEAMRNSGMTKSVVVNLFIAQEYRAAEINKLPERLSEAKKQSAIGGIDEMVVAQLKEFNRWICGVAQKHPEIVPFVGADMTALSGASCAEHVTDLVENYGAHGVKLHGAAGGFDMSDRQLWPMYSVCENLGVPIIGHSGPDRGGAGFAEPRAFGHMLREFPRLTVVLAHMGGATWSQALEIAETYPNAFFDCCEIIEWTGGTNAPSEVQLAKLIKDIGPHRVMMGSDFPWYDLDHTVERVMGLPLLSTEEKEGILGANALNILNL